MPGIFQQELSGVDSRPATFRTRAPSPIDVSGLVQAGVIANSARVLSNTTEDLEAAQDDFLQRSERQGHLEVAQAEAVREADVLETSGAEQAILQEAKDKVDRISKAVAANKLDPYEASIRAQSIINRAAASPFITQGTAQAILRLGTTGTRASSFNAEVEHQIALKQKQDEAILEMGYHPDDPAGLLALVESRQLKARADTVKNAETVDSSVAKDIAYKRIAELSAVLARKVSQIDRDNADPETITRLVNELGVYADPVPAEAYVRETLSNDYSAVFLSKIPDDAIKGMVAMVQGQASIGLAYVSGDVPAKALKSRRALADEVNYQKFAASKPGAAAAMSVMTIGGFQQSVGFGAVQKDVGADLLEFFMKDVNQQIPTRPQTQDEINDWVASQKDYSKALKNLRSDITSDKVKGRAIEGIAQRYLGAMQAQASHPDSAIQKHAAVYEEEMAAFADPLFWNKLKKEASPETVQALSDEFTEYATKYAQNKLVPDMTRAVQKKRHTPVIQRGILGSTVRDIGKTDPDVGKILVKIMPDENGKIKIVPSDEVQDQKRATDAAQELQFKYGRRYNTMIDAFINVYGNEGVEQFSSAILR